MDNLGSFLLAAIALIGSPGPATLSLAAAGAAFGVRNAMPLLIGLGLGILSITIVTATGVTGLLLTVPGLVPVMTGLAIAYMVYLAYRIATAPPMSAPDEAQKPPSAVSGFVLNLSNPKAYAAMAALFSGFNLFGERPLLDVSVKIWLILFVMVVVDLAWVLVGATLARRLRNSRVSRSVNVMFAVALLGSIGFAFFL